MSHSFNTYAERFTHRSLNRRTLAEMQRKVDKRGKRNAVSRFILAKGDKDKIAAWKQDLVRVLQVFNVCSIDPVRRSPNLAPRFRPSWQ